MTPEEALERVRPPGGHPVITAELHGGVTSRSFLVRGGEGPYILRVDEPLAATLGLNRPREFAVLQAVAAAGAGAAPLAFWPGPPAVLLRPFVPGRVWTPRDLDEPRQRSRLAGALRRVHAIPHAGIGPAGIIRAIEHYAALLGGRSRDLAAHAAQLAAQVGGDPARLVLCHNDAVAGNLIEAGELQVIDWEYAGTGEPLFDLAVVIQHHELDEDAAVTLLSDYLGRAPTAPEQTRLGVQRRLYDVLLVSWLHVLKREAGLDEHGARQLVAAQARIAP